MPVLLLVIWKVGVNNAFTPPTMALEHSPRDNAFNAWWSATKELEQAVSMGSLGPVKLKMYDTRLAKIEENVPVELCASIPGPAAWISSR